MSILKKLFSKKPKDERVVGEVNRIYRIGYFILSAGILVDLYLQMASGVNAEPIEFTIRPVEMLALLASCVVCIVMMLKKGLSDEDRYAEAEKFPTRHYLLQGVVVGMGTGAVMIVLRAILMLPGWNYEIWLFWAAQAIVFVSMVVLMVVFIPLAQYAMFRIAKRQRAAMQQEDDQE